MDSGARTGVIHAGVTELRLVPIARASARQIVWQPARSWGGVIGVALCALSVATVGGLAAAAVLTSSVPTRLLAVALELPLLLAFGTCALGTWRWFTLTYALAPSALEIRHGTRRVRVRYEDVTRVILPDTAGGGPGSWLWPGAPAGDERIGPGRIARWWGTTQRPASRVLVETTAGSLLLTPTRPQAFAEALLSNRGGAPNTPGSTSPRPGWLELVASVDPWVRILAGLALVVAAGGIFVDVIRTGAASRHTSVATIGLLANTALVGLVVRHSPHAARVAMTATLVLQCLGVLL